MKRWIICFVILSLFVLITACTEQSRTRLWGGSSTVDLPVNQKLVMATWKSNNLWFLTRDMRPEEKPETYSFSESASWGIYEGAITIKERTLATMNQTNRKPGVEIDLWSPKGPTITIIDPPTDKNGDGIVVRDN